MTTLFNAIRFLDESFTREAIPRARVHLFSAACLWVSAKVEETALYRSLELFLEACRNEFDADGFRREELAVLVLTKGRLNHPTVAFLIRPLLDALGAAEMEELVIFWAILSLYDSSLVAVSAPLVAASAIIGAMGDGCLFDKLYLVVPEAKSTEKVLDVMEKLLAVGQAALQHESNAIRDHYPVEQIKHRLNVMEATIQDLRSRV
jgi:hypothetical protein